MGIAEQIAQGNAILPPGYKAAKSYKHIVVPEEDWLRLAQIAQNQGSKPTTIIRAAIKQMYTKMGLDK